MTTRSLTLCCLALAGALVGCTQSDSNIRPASANWETPDAGPTVTTAALESGEAYPVCSWDDVSRCPVVDEDGHRGAYSFGPDLGCWEACQCRNECEVDADCPSADTGSVAPACFHGMCVLPCDAEEDRCPTGMACVPDASRDANWCMWVTQTDCD